MLVVTVTLVVIICLPLDSSQSACQFQTDLYLAELSVTVYRYVHPFHVSQNFE